ncbi:MAG: hypothetical protein Q4C47_09085, partial [Planctomycetia bacterium]|nr:hypothetical protein [Planctomycetia bacterium]
GETEVTGDGEKSKTPERSDTPPEPVLVQGNELMTRDGVPLRGTWFGSVRGKNATPVLILSGTERSRSDYRGLAPALQSQGFAVLAVDIRLAGPTTFDENPDRNDDAENTESEDTTEDEAEPDDTTEDGTETSEESTIPEKSGTSAKKKTVRQERPWERLRPGDLEMVVEDIEICRDWLAVKNNEEELNLNALCIVASDAICIAAIDWMARDWSGELGGTQRAFTTTRITGQTSRYSKAIVLLSPIAGVRGYDLCRIASDQPTIGKIMPVMLFVGKKNREDMKDAAKIRKFFEKTRRNEEKEKKEKKDRTFFYWECDTDVTGSAMLGEEDRLPGWIGQFFREKVTAGKLPWNAVPVPAGR